MTRRAVGVLGVFVLAVWALAGAAGALAEPVASAGGRVLWPGDEGVLGPGGSLAAGQWLSSPSGRYRLSLGPGGGLVLYDAAPEGPSVLVGAGVPSVGEHHLGPAVLWRSGAAGAPAGLLEVGADGDVVLRRVNAHGAGAPLWSTRTGGWPGAMLQVSDDGTASVRTVSGRVLWTAGASTPDVGLAGVRHVVYGRSAQRVWMIGADGLLHDTYPVSGHAASPARGVYAVFSKSELTQSVSGTVTMTHMVRFARGGDDLAIGFHGIPRRLDGAAIQRVDDLGRARSAGCVRQQDSKAAGLYGWAPIGTPVVVLD